MKVILSRKGFDSGYGGCPSPIFPDGSMFSLPIPSARGSRSFGDVNYGEHNLGNVVASLTNGTLKSDSMMHFDPDLAFGAVPRKPGWKPSLGQVAGSLSHLNNQGIGPGDLFLFFGWFRSAEITESGSYQFIRGAMDQHVIFGWLQVGEIIDVGSDGISAVSKMPWLEKHPHVVGTWEQNNSIYIASETLNIFTGTSTHSISGGGTFDRVTGNRILTHSGQDKRSLWSLPKSFSPHFGQATLTYNVNPENWHPSQDEERVLLASAKKGQEFVLTSNDEKTLISWLSGIFVAEDKGISI